MGADMNLFNQCSHMLLFFCIHAGWHFFLPKHQNTRHSLRCSQSNSIKTQRQNGSEIEDICKAVEVPPKTLLIEQMEEHRPLKGWGNRDTNTGAGQNHHQEELSANSEVDSWLLSFHCKTLHPTLFNFADAHTHTDKHSYPFPYIPRFDLWPRFPSPHVFVFVKSSILSYLVFQNLILEVKKEVFLPTVPVRN